MQFDYAYAHVVIFRVQYILAADTESASCQSSVYVSSAQIGFLFRLYAFARLDSVGTSKANMY